MTHASLFSGIGGCEVAAAMLGWDNLFHCEINPFGRSVLDYWFPNSESYADITKTNFEKWRGRVDVLTGGFPCQPFSYAGQRRGAADDRYLWPEMLRAIQECRPTWVIGENVAGITTMVEPGEITEVGVQTSLFGETDSLRSYQMRSRFTLERVCSDLESIGYSVQPIIIPACAVGAPHRRDRIFIVGHALADSNKCDDGRDTRDDGGKEGKERLQERNAVRFLGVASQVRPEGQGDALPNTYCDRTRTSGESGEVKGSGSHSDQLSHQRSAETRWVDGFLEVSRHASDTASDGLQHNHISREERGVSSTQGCDSELHISTSADGCGRTPADTDHAGNGSPERKSGRAGQTMDGERKDIALNWTGRLGRTRTTADSESKQSDGLRPDGRCCESAQGELGRGYRTTISGGGKNYECGQRWAAFPTVSPIHRGNDGLPFDVDGLTIPFNKWRQEALKAYGNAIVPQVVYEIFRAIEEVEQSNQ